MLRPLCALFVCLGGIRAFAPPAPGVARARLVRLREATTEEKKATSDFTPLDVDVSDVDEFLIQWGLKEDPRVPEECRVDPMTRVKQSGKALSSAPSNVLARARRPDASVPFRARAGGHRRLHHHGVRLLARVRAAGDRGRGLHDRLAPGRELRRRQGGRPRARVRSPFVLRGPGPGTRDPGPAAREAREARGGTRAPSQVAGYVFVFINFARVIVPARIALALALAPWCDRNIIQKYFPEKVDEDCVVPEDM